MLAFPVLIIWNAVVSLDQFRILIIVLAGLGGTLLALLDEIALTNVEATATFIILSNFCEITTLTFIHVFIGQIIVAALILLFALNFVRHYMIIFSVSLTEFVIALLV